MEETVVASGMETLFTGITTTVTNMLTLFGTVSAEMIKIEFFQLVLGIVMLFIAMGMVWYMIKKIKRKGK